MNNYLAVLILCSLHNVLLVHGSLGSRLGRIPSLRGRQLTTGPSMFIPQSPDDDIHNDMMNIHNDMMSQMENKMRNIHSQMCGNEDCPFNSNDGPFAMTKSLFQNSNPQDILSKMSQINPAIPEKTPTSVKKTFQKDRTLPRNAVVQIRHRTWTQQNGEEPDIQEHHHTITSGHDDSDDDNHTSPQYPKDQENQRALDSGNDDSCPFEQAFNNLFPNSPLPKFSRLGSNRFPSNPIVRSSSSKIPSGYMDTQPPNGFERQNNQGSNNKQIDDNLDDLRQAILKRHNEYRSQHGAGPLQLSDDLNRSSQAWAEHCLATGTDDHSPRGIGGPGENIDYEYKMSSAVTFYHLEPTHSVDQWYSEKSYSGGHYTQVVWKSSKYLGCGIATKRGPGSAERYVVCQYDPAGNSGDYINNV